MTCPSGRDCRWVPYVGISDWEMCDNCLIERQVPMRPDVVLKAWERERGGVTRPTGRSETGLGATNGSTTANRTTDNESGAA